jgi:hypothetical protein
MPHSTKGRAAEAALTAQVTLTERADSCVTHDAVRELLVTVLACDGRWVGDRRHSRAAHRGPLHGGLLNKGERLDGRSRHLAIGSADAPRVVPQLRPEGRCRVGGVAHTSSAEEANYGSEPDLMAVKPGLEHPTVQGEVTSTGCIAHRRVPSSAHAGP